MDRAQLYEKGREIGRGTYGAVYAARRKDDNVQVAIKRVHGGIGTEGVDFTALREIKVLGDAKHENVLGLLDVFATKGKIFLVMELMDTDLYELIQDKRCPMQLSHIKQYLHQAISGVANLHERFVAHRDLKPANLLVNRQGVVKVADLGMSRAWGFRGEMLSPQVVTRQYRAPELLFGAPLYDANAVDVWAMACIALELFNRTIFFPGSSDIDQLSRIFAVLGVPNDESWPHRQQLPDFVEFESDPAGVAPLATHVPTAPPTCVHLLESMLVFDPKLRMPLVEVLKSPFWSEMCPREKLIPDAILKSAQQQ
jgi:cyclin-dependent kinase 7